MHLARGYLYEGSEKMPTMRYSKPTWSLGSKIFATRFTV